ncbi:hypothetical protein Cgig2_007090 [Carnegiea gigantea]|uniref:Uncharacterized protein n=1 Tax=Carnegiea gigantea TaxID=171969 RepID=A0A9Q1JSC6_9CARY|nr:hypothetical protein Cgig2_007090 [Carnegiea gigantea]
MQVWFYNHSSIYAFADERMVSRLGSWINLYKGKKYDTGVVVRKLKGSEVGDDKRRIEAVEVLIASEEYSAYLRDERYASSVRAVCCIVDMERLRRARDALKKEREALAKEKEAHAATKKELDDLNEAVAMKTAVDDILEFTRIQGLNAIVDTPGMPADAGSR